MLGAIVILNNYTPWPQFTFPQCGSLDSSTSLDNLLVHDDGVQDTFPRMRDSVIPEGRTTSSRPRDLATSTAANSRGCAVQRAMTVRVLLFYQTLRRRGSRAVPRETALFLALSTGSTGQSPTKDAISFTGEEHAHERSFNASAGFPSPALSSFSWTCLYHLNGMHPVCPHQTFRQRENVFAAALLTPSARLYQRARWWIHSRRSSAPAVASLTTAPKREEPHAPVSERGIARRHGASQALEANLPLCSAGRNARPRFATAHQASRCLFALLCFPEAASPTSPIQRRMPPPRVCLADIHF